MPKRLEEQVINFPIARGRDGGSDPQVVSENLLEAKNVVQDKRGSLNKRTGYSQGQVEGEGTAVGVGMFPTDLDQPAAIFKQNGASSSSDDRFVARYLHDGAWEDFKFHGLAPLDVRATPVSSLVDQTENIESLGLAVNESLGYFCVASVSDTTGTLKAIVVELDNNIAVGSTTRIPSLLGVSKCRVISNPDQNSFEVFFIDGSANLRYISWSSGGGWTSPTTLLTSVTNYDIAPAVRSGVNQFVVVHMSPGAGADRYNTSWVNQASFTGLSGILTDIYSCWQRPSSSDQVVMAGLELNADEVNLHVLDVDTDTASNAGTYLNMGDNVDVVLGATDSPVGSTYGTVFTVSNDLGARPVIGSSLSTALEIRPINSGPIVPLSPPILLDSSGTQSGFLVSRDSTLYLYGYGAYGLPLANFFIDSIDETVNPRYVAKAVQLTSGKTLACIPTNTGIVRLDIEQVEGLPYVISEGQPLLGGGLLRMVDKGALYSAGPMAPPTIPAALTETSGGSIAAGSYSVRATHEYTDSTGRLWRSRPSVAQTIDVSTNSYRIQGRVSILPSPGAGPLGLQDSDQNPVTKVWRTEDDGEIHYLANTDSAYSETSFTLSEADATIIDNASLYTTGGVLENDFPPSFAVMGTYRNRVLGVPMEDRNLVWYSKARAENLGVEFSQFLTLRFSVPEITAIGDMDDVCVVFGETEIYAFHGEGPNDLGVGQFSVPRRLGAAVGCVDWRTLIEIPDGLLFKSLEGWYVLGRDLRTRYIGSPVKDFDDTEVKRTLRSGDREATIFLADGTVLVLDLDDYSWYIWDNHTNLVDAVKVSDGVHWLDSSNQASSPDGSFTDGSASYGMLIDTPWFSLGGVAGFQRLWEVGIQGTWKSSHTLKVTIYYNYDETDSAEYTLSLTSSTVPYLMRIKPNKQRANAIRLRIEDTSQAGTEESFSLLGIKLKVGVAPKTPFNTGRELT